MIQVEFIYRPNNIIIQCNKDEKMKEIFKIFFEKIKIDKNTIYFMNNENKILNDELSLGQICNENDKLINHFKIIVNPIKNC